MPYRRRRPCPRTTPWQSERETRQSTRRHGKSLYNQVRRWKITVRDLVLHLRRPGGVGARRASNDAFTPALGHCHFLHFRRQHLRWHEGKHAKLREMRNQIDKARPNLLVALVPLLVHLFRYARHCRAINRREVRPVRNKRWHDATARSLSPRAAFRPERGSARTSRGALRAQYLLRRGGQAGLFARRHPARADSAASASMRAPANS